MVLRNYVVHEHLRYWTLNSHRALSETVVAATRDLLSLARTWAEELGVADSFDEVVDCVRASTTPSFTPFPHRDYLYAHEMRFLFFAEHLYRGQFNAVCRERESEPLELYIIPVGD